MEEVLSPLYRLSTAGADVQKKAGSFTGISGIAGVSSNLHDDFPDHLRCAAVCQALEELHAQLPAITLFMLAIGKHAQEYGPFIAVGLVISGIVLWRWKATDRGAAKIDHFILKLPLLGSIWLKYQVAGFSRTLSTLLSGGLPLVPSLQTAGESMSSRSILNGISAATIQVREGQTLAKSLEEQKLFPDLSVEMIEVGESTGALPAMLNSVAEFYEEDVQTALGAAMALIEPVILIFMAVVVGGILISLYLPIFTLGSNIH